MNAIDKLTEYFRTLPGIGPRQAKRFVYFLLTREKEFLTEFSNLLSAIKKEIRVCDNCQRFFNGASTVPLCKICNDKNRDPTEIMIVEKDIDLENIEKSHAYNGYYFVLGGTVPILEKEPETKVRSRECLAYVKRLLADKKLKEIILAFAVNAEGESTSDYLHNLFKPLIEEKGLKISALGRGLSTGSEVEYTDSETIKNALKNRS
ncbi:MAG: toprim domain-containing protein [bacterium]|nr:toprim domain-containing protein [bacterium]